MSRRSRLDTLPTDVLECVYTFLALEDKVNDYPSEHRMPMVDFPGYKCYLVSPVELTSERLKRVAKSQGLWSQQLCVMVNKAHLYWFDSIRQHHVDQLRRVRKLWNELYIVHVSIELSNEDLRVYSKCLEDILACTHPLVKFRLIFLKPEKEKEYLEAPRILDHPWNTVKTLVTPLLARATSTLALFQCSEQQSALHFQPLLVASSAGCCSGLQLGFFSDAYWRSQRPSCPCEPRVRHQFSSALATQRLVKTEHTPLPVPLSAAPTDSVLHVVASSLANINSLHLTGCMLNQEILRTASDGAFNRYSLFFNSVSQTLRFLTLRVPKRFSVLVEKLLQNRQNQNNAALQFPCLESINCDLLGLHMLRYLNARAERVVRLECSALDIPKQWIPCEELVAEITRPSKYLNVWSVFGPTSVDVHQALFPEVTAAARSIVPTPTGSNIQITYCFPQLQCLSLSATYAGPLNHPRVARRPYEKEIRNIFDHLVTQLRCPNLSHLRVPWCRLGSLSSFLSQYKSFAPCLQSLDLQEIHTTANSVDELVSELLVFEDQLSKVAVELRLGQWVGSLAGMDPTQLFIRAGYELCNEQATFRCGCCSAENISYTVWRRPS